MERAIETLTPQKAEFVRQMAAGMTQTEAGRAVGHRSVGTASKWLNDENLRLALKQAAIEQGNTPESIGKTLREAREAIRTELSRDGIPVDLGPDHRSRIQASDVLLKLMGGYPKPGELELNAQNVLVIRADQGLASADPFNVASLESGGTEVLAIPETLSESALTRSEFDYIS